MTMNGRAIKTDEDVAKQWLDELDGIRVTGEALNNIAPVIEAARAVCLGYYKKPFDMMDGVEMDDLQAALEAFEKETGDE